MRRRRKNNNSWFTAFLLFAIFFGLGVFATWDTIYYSFYEQVEVCDTTKGYDYEANGNGGNISANISFTFGQAGSIVTTTKQRHGSTSKTTKYYYIIPVVLNEKDCFICTEVPESEKSDFDALLNGNLESIKVTGTFKKLDDQMYGYMLECMEDLNSYYKNKLYKDESELKEYVLPVCLVPLYFEYRNLMIGVLCGLLFMAILSFCMYRRKKKKIAAEEAAEAAYEAQQMNTQTFTDNHAEQSDGSVPETANTTLTTDTNTSSDTKQYHNTLDEFNDKHNS